MYYCGWDGGGTKTEVCLLDANGQVLETRSFGPLNPNGTARETVEATVQDCLALMAEYGLSHCAGLVIGIAGVSNADAAGLVEDAFASYERKVLVSQREALSDAEEAE